MLTRADSLPIRESWGVAGGLAFPFRVLEGRMGAVWRPEIVVIVRLAVWCRIFWGRVQRLG